MFKKILVPLDGSDLAAKILPQVEELAKHTKAQVTLLSRGLFRYLRHWRNCRRRPSRRAPPCPEIAFGQTIWSKSPASCGPQVLTQNGSIKRGHPAQRDRGVCGRESDGSHRHRLPWRRRDRLATGERGPTGHRSRHGVRVVAAGGGSRASHPQKRDVSIPCRRRNETNMEATSSPSTSAAAML